MGHWVEILEGSENPVAGLGPDETIVEIFLDRGGKAKRKFKVSELRGEIRALDIVGLIDENVQHGYTFGWVLADAEEGEPCTLKHNRTGEILRLELHETYCIRTVYTAFGI